MDLTTGVLAAAGLLGLGTSCVAVGVTGAGHRLPAVLWALPAGLAAFIGVFRAAGLLVAASAGLGAVPLDRLVAVAATARADAAAVRQLGLGLCAGALAATAWGIAVGGLLAPGRFAPGRAVLSVGAAAFFPTLGALAVWLGSGPTVAAAFGLCGVALALAPATAVARDLRPGPVAPTASALALGAAALGALALRPDDPDVVVAAVLVVAPTAAVASAPAFLQAAGGTWFSGASALLALGVLLAPIGVARARRAPLDAVVDLGRTPAVGVVPGAVGVRGEAGGDDLVGHCKVSVLGEGPARVESVVAEPLYPPLAGLPVHPDCPPDGGALLPLPGSVRPVVVWSPSARASDLLAAPWFRGAGTMHVLARADDGTLRGVPLEVRPGERARMWVAERSGETAVFLEDRLVGTLEDPAFVTRLRVARTRSAADAVRLVVTDEWSVQELVSRCVTLREATAPDGPVRCLVVLADRE